MRNLLLPDGLPRRLTVNGPVEMVGAMTPESIATAAAPEGHTIFLDDHEETPGSVAGVLNILVDDSESMPQDTGNAVRMLADMANPEVVEEPMEAHDAAVEILAGLSEDADADEWRERRLNP